MSESPQYHIQGDILFRMIGDSVPSRDRKDKSAVDRRDAAARYLGAAHLPEDGFFVLAMGEKTGHSHRVAEDVSAVHNIAGGYKGDLALVLFKGAEIVHEEHPPLALDAGVYAVQQQREHNPYREIEESDQERQISRARFD